MHRQVKARNLFLTAFLTLLFSALLFLNAAQAEEQLYVIRNLTVDKVADNAVEARDIAIAEGQREAYNMLADRLLLSESGEIGLEEVSDTQINRMISDFETRNERFSDKRYRAEMTVRFKADAVQQFLGQSQTTKLSEAQSKPVLILPLVRDEATGEVSLWSGNNAWLQAWQGVSDNLQLVPVIVPAGSARDATLASEAEVLTGSAADVEQLRQHYGADRVVLAEGVLTDAGVDIKIYEYIADTLSETKAFSVSSSGQAAQKWAVAVRSVQDYLNDNWKKQLRYSSNSLARQPVVLQVRFDTMKDWLRMKRIIDQSAQIKDVEMRALRRGYAEVGAVLTGELDALQNNFSTQNIVFQKAADGGTMNAESNIYEVFETAAHQAPLPRRQGQSGQYQPQQQPQQQRLQQPQQAPPLRQPLRYETMIDSHRNQSNNRHEQP